MTRRAALLTFALLGWLLCFAVLAQLGTWTPFVFVGLILVSLALQSSAVPLRQFQASRRSVQVGLGVGVLMVLVTHVVYDRLASVFPAVQRGTLQLFSLVEGVGFSRPARAALIVVIASCEEILFRGLLPCTPRGTQRAFGLPLNRELGGILGWSAVYALTTVPLASPLLVLCAFACGTVWATLRVATGSVLVPILAHVLWDLGVLLVWPLPG